MIRASGLDGLTIATDNFNNLPFKGRSTEGIAVDSGNPNIVAVCSGNYGSSSHVWLCENAKSGNPTFVDISDDLPDVPVYDIVIDRSDPGHFIIVGTELGIWTYSKDYDCWTEQNTGIGRYPVYSLKVEHMNQVGCKVIYAGTHGRGIFPYNHTYF